MKNKYWLLLIAAVMFLSPVALIYAYMWQAGLDLQNPSSAREWTKVCARSRIDIYCKAANSVLREVEGPIIFLHPNQGDDVTADEIARLYGRVPTIGEVDAIVKANILKASKLTSGVMKTLDGQKRHVECPMRDRARACKIENLIGGLTNSPGDEMHGAVYSVSQSDKGYSFLLPVNLKKLRIVK